MGKHSLPRKPMGTRLHRFRVRCYRVVMHNGTHVGSLVALHVVALYVLKHIPYIPH